MERNRRGKKKEKEGKKWKRKNKEHMFRKGTENRKKVAKKMNMN